jgi:hypothetical protein
LWSLVRPFFRYSVSRDAYVLRGVGGTVGPVIKEELVKPAGMTPRHLT